MRYIDFKASIHDELQRHSTGLTWSELKRRLRLPYARPCPNWVSRLEKEIGLTRSRGAKREFIWRVRPRSE